VATRAEQLGFDSVWLAEPPAGDGEDRALHADGCTVAAYLAPATSSIHLGVTIGDRDGRHPSMAARDVTALDHVTGGRSALQLRYASAIDAVAICHGMFNFDTTTVNGREFHTQGAVNRPPPLQQGGPPLVVDVSGGGDIPPGTVDAVCAEGSPEELERLGVALRSMVVTEGLDAGTALWWAGALPGAGVQATGYVSDLRDAGVTGFICRLPGDEWPTPSAVDALAASLTDCGLV
jgi:hypothetical protein